jgi:hypothetical protein
VDAKLIACRKHGQFVHSCVVPKTIADYSTALGNIAGTNRSSRSPKKD